MSEAVTSFRSEGQWIPRVTRTPKDLGLQEEASRRAGLMETDKHLPHSLTCRYPANSFHDGPSLELEARVVD